MARTRINDGLMWLVGIIQPYGGSSAPSGWLICDGSSELRADYPELFAVVGTAFGTADGTHFNVPDMRGRFLRGMDDSVGRDPDRAGRTAMNAGGNTGDNVGTLQAEDHLSHNHTGTSGSSLGVTGHSVNESNVNLAHTHNTNQLSATPGATCAAAGGYSYPATASTSALGSHNHSVSVDSHNLAHTHTITANGGNETRPLNAYVNYIIKF